MILRQLSYLGLPLLFGIIATPISSGQNLRSVDAFSKHIQRNKDSFETDEKAPNLGVRDVRDLDGNIDNSDEENGVTINIDLNNRNDASREGGESGANYSPEPQPRGYYIISESFGSEDSKKNKYSQRKKSRDDKKSRRETYRTYSTRKSFDRNKSKNKTNKSTKRDKLSYKPTQKDTEMSYKSTKKYTEISYKSSKKDTEMSKKSTKMSYRDSKDLWKSRASKSNKPTKRDTFWSESISYKFTKKDTGFDWWEAMSMSYSYDGVGVKEKYEDKSEDDKSKKYEYTLRIP